MKQDAKQQYHERYDAFKKQGHSFWPYTIFEDVVVCAILLVILLALAVFVGVPEGTVADPTNLAYIPRPEWYFMFLFEMLKYFPGHLEWVGVAVVPGVLVFLLLLLPFYDRRPVRQPARRPLAMALGVLALVAIVFLTVKAFQSTPPTVSAQEDGVRLTTLQQTGKALYKAQECSSCHAIRGEGGQVGPPLDGIGNRLSASQIHLYIEYPQALNPSAVMPSFLGPMSHTEVEAVAQYLATLKGGTY